MRMHMLFILLLSSFTAFSQAGTISGRISDKITGAAGATVSLLRARDSAVVKLTVAAKEGTYTFDNIAEGQYLVSVTATAYQKAYSRVFSLSAGQSITLLPIELVALPKTMTAVTVTAKKPLVEHRADRTIVNVDASVTNVGANALEVLEKSPGISVDKDGNISLRGKEGVMVLIDGRPTQLGGTDLANMLRSMNATQLDQVEIMTNPPAKYDAAGNAGIINIKTKKNRSWGSNGALSLGYTQGRYPKTNESFNYNYRQGKTNFFTNISHDYRKNFQLLTIQRSLRSNSTAHPESYFDQRADMLREGNSWQAKAGVDYFVNKRTTVGMVLSGYYSTNTADNQSRTFISSASRELQGITRSTFDNAASWRNFSGNLNFRTLLDTTGREWSADLDYITYGSRNNQFMVNSYYTASGAVSGAADSLQGSLPQDIAIYSGRIDYLHPLRNNSRFEAGIKSSIVRTDNNAWYDSIQNGNIVHDVYRSNHFIYEENINAAYVNMNYSFTKKFSAQMGLRMENTNAKGNQLTTGQQFDRHYTQLFPTAYLQYKVSDHHQLNMNFGRRIRRPNYESLNPFIRFIDRYTYSQGNPDLLPQFSNNIELSHSFRNQVTTSLNYSITHDILQQVIEQNGQETFTRQANIASLEQAGISVHVNAPVTKWWTNNFFVNAYTFRYSGVVSNTPVRFSDSRISMNTTQQFQVSKTLSAELSGFYRTGGIEGVIRIKSMGALSAGLSQQVLKNRGNIRLTVRDVFYTQVFDATIRYGNVDAMIRESRDSRTVNLAFTWRFSKGKMAAPKKKAGGSAADEQNRIGGF
ncbi:MAG TPA: TonB-dependent receptor [Flavisolibacter sp.]